MSETVSMTYVARAECGCVRGVAVDQPEHRKDVAKALSQWVRGGHAIERLPTETVRSMDWKCGADDCPFIPDPNRSDTEPYDTAQYELTGTSGDGSTT